MVNEAYTLGSTWKSPFSRVATVPRFRWMVQLPGVFGPACHLGEVVSILPNFGVFWTGNTLRDTSSFFSVWMSPKRWMRGAVFRISTFAYFCGGAGGSWSPGTPQKWRNYSLGPSIRTAPAARGFRRLGTDRGFLCSLPQVNPIWDRDPAGNLGSSAHEDRRHSRIPCEVYNLEGFFMVLLPKHAETTYDGLTTSLSASKPTTVSTT